MSNRLSITLAMPALRSPRATGCLTRAREIALRRPASARLVLAGHDGPHNRARDLLVELACIGECHRSRILIDSHSDGNGARMGPCIAADSRYGSTQVWNPCWKIRPGTADPAYWQPWGLPPAPPTANPAPAGPSCPTALTSRSSPAPPRLRPHAVPPAPCDT